MAESIIPEPAGSQHVGLVPVVGLGLAVIAVFFIGFGTWAALAPLDSAAIAPGVVSPDTKRKTVQHLEGGIIEEILVREGQRVDSGQTLIRLSSVQPDANLGQLHAAYRAIGTLASRLVAERDNATQIAFPEWLVALADQPEVANLQRNQVDVFEARLNAHREQVTTISQQIGQLNEEIIGIERQIVSDDQQLDLLAEEIADMQILWKKGLIPKPRLLSLQRRQAEIEGNRGRNQAAIARTQKAIAEAHSRIAELNAGRVNEAATQLQETESRVLELTERMRAAGDIVSRTEIRAPLPGTVVDLKVHTLGGVIAPGEALLDIVPDNEPLLVDARIDPSDIDVVSPGLAAQVRLTAFQQRHVQPIDGVLVSVSADSLQDERTGEPYYLGRVALTKTVQDGTSEFALLPGMQAQVMIQTGRGTLLDYLTRPIELSLERALREN